MTDYPVIIIGSGVAGLSSAIYTAREDNETLVINGGEPGGQLTLTTDVANYPGFPDGVGGHELIQRMKDQASQFGTEFKNGIVETITKPDDEFYVELSDGEVITSDTVIVASGAEARTLGIEGEDEYMGYGVSTCATCDGAFYRDDQIAIVGGGDAAVEEAIFLTKFGETVHLIHRRDELRAQAYLQNELQEHIESGDIEPHWNTELTEIHGEDSQVTSVSGVTHPDGHPTDKPDAEEFSLDVDAVFMAIGHTPNTEFLADLGIPLTEDGYVDLDYNQGPNATQSTVDGLFVSGDVFDYHYQQAGTAVGTGIQAAIDANNYL